jgi:Fic family protein
MKVERLTEIKKLIDRAGEMPEALARNLHEWFRVELTYTSNALEGNTLTRRETAMVVEKGITVGGKSLVEHLEATNHAQAFDWIAEKSRKPLKNFTENDLLALHKMILSGIDNQNAGFYRNVPVRLSGSRTVLPNPRKVPDLMSAFHQWLQSSQNIHPVDLAAEAHYRLVTIHPFVDGNGRTARLLMNFILLCHGYPPSIIRKSERGKYLDALENAQTGGAFEDYLQLIYRAVGRSLEIYVEATSGEGDFVAEPDDSLLRIGQLAKQADVNVSTIRFWLSSGLLEVSETTASGYQLFSSSMVLRVEQIKTLKEQRFTIQEIKSKLAG